MKRALVTGGSGALGAAICRRLAADGLEVIIHANTNEDRALDIKGDIQAAGGKALTVTFDVTDPDISKAAVTGLLEEGPIQVIVSNAGIHADAPMAGMSFEQWRSVVARSVSTAFSTSPSRCCCRCSGPAGAG